MEGKLIFKLMAGIPRDVNGWGDFPLISFGRWLFPIGLYLLVMGFYLEITRKNRIFLLPRYGFIQRWWRFYFWKNIGYGGLAAAILTIILAAFSVSTEVAGKMDLAGFQDDLTAIFILWTVHGMTLLALFLSMEILNLRKIIPSMLLLLEGMTFLCGYRCERISHYMFGAWGMYVQSDWYDKGYGFSTEQVVLVEIVLIIGCYLFGDILLKNHQWEGAFSNGR